MKQMAANSMSKNYNKPLNIWKTSDMSTLEDQLFEENYIIIVSTWQKRINHYDNILIPLPHNRINQWQADSGIMKLSLG